MKKRSIPSLPMDGGPDRRAFDMAVKEDLEIIMGQRGDKIRQLDSTATTEEIVSKINEIIARLQ